MDTQTDFTKDNLEELRVKYVHEREGPVYSSSLGSESNAGTRNEKDTKAEVSQSHVKNPQSSHINVDDLQALKEKFAHTR